MPRLGKKRQITLSVDQCKMAGIEPGDECESYVDNYGHIIIVKKPKGTSKELKKLMMIDSQIKVK